MSEYIITDKQLKTATEAYLEHELSRPITEVFISGDKLPKIVRCRDCKWFDADVYVLPNDENWVYSCDFWGAVRHVPSPDGFCSYGERRTNDNYREWLYSLEPSELSAWFDAEHVEHQERALDGDADALEAKIAALEKKLRISWEYECKFQAERDKFKEANDYHAAQYELASEDCDRLQAQVDKLTAERDNWKEHSRTIEYRCKKAETDCEIYRKKFGKCIDYADAIHALMDDEGLA